MAADRESVGAFVCHRCERADHGGVWLTVHQFGAHPKTWQFCSIECLGQHFEVPDDRLQRENEKLRRWLRLPGHPAPEGYFDV